MDIKATTEEIHRKLDKLGLSQRWAFPIGEGGCLTFTNSNCCAVQFRSNGKYPLVWTLPEVTWRACIVNWILFGGKLRYKR